MNTAGASDRAGRLLLHSTMDLTRRTVTEDDEPFLQMLFAIVTAEQLKFAELGIGGDQAIALIAHQYNAYTHFYRTTYASADDCILMADSAPAGRLITIDFDHEIRLSDIMIMPEYRRRGICTQVMRDAVASGEASGRIVTLHVERTNPALELYRREGFVVHGESSTHYVMQWQMPSHE